SDLPGDGAPLQAPPPMHGARLRARAGLERGERTMNEDRFSRERAAGYSEAILDRAILLVGAGALGGALASQLAMWGFRRATVVDFDTYEMSNAARVLDFPYERIRRGEMVFKAEELARTWRCRLERSGLDATEIHGVVGFAQELAPALWRAAD